MRLLIEEFTSTRNKISAPSVGKLMGDFSRLDVSQITADECKTYYSRCNMIARERWPFSRGHTPQHGGFIAACAARDMFSTKEADKLWGHACGNGGDRRSNVP